MSNAPWILLAGIGFVLGMLMPRQPIWRVAGLGLLVGLTALVFFGSRS